MPELTEKQAQWKVHIDAALAAGQSLAEYGREHDLELKKLYSYNRAIQQRLGLAVEPKFVRVQQPMAPTGGLGIEFRNGVRVSMAAPVDLGSLLAQLAKLP